MKECISIRVIVKNEGTEDRYEVESCWSQETEMFCEKIAEIVKIFTEEMNEEAETTRCFDLIEQLNAIESGVKRE